jgi:hypothetical protein
MVANISKGLYNLLRLAISMIFYLRCKAALLGHPFMGLLRATIFCIIKHMSGAHRVVAGVVSVYVIEVQGGQPISPVENHKKVKELQLAYW